MIMEKDIEYYFLKNCNFLMQTNSIDKKITFYGLNNIYPFRNFNHFKVVWESKTNARIVALFKPKTK